MICSHDEMRFDGYDEIELKDKSQPGQKVNPVTARGLENYLITISCNCKAGICLCQHSSSVFRWGYIKEFHCFVVYMHT